MYKPTPSSPINRAITTRLTKPSILVIIPAAMRIRVPLKSLFCHFINPCLLKLPGIIYNKDMRRCRPSMTSLREKWKKERAPSGETSRRNIQRSFAAFLYSKLEEFKILGYDDVEHEFMVILNT